MELSICSYISSFVYYIKATPLGPDILLSTLLTLQMLLVSIQVQQILRAIVHRSTGAPALGIIAKWAQIRFR
jgi:hypothetical protein